MFPPSKRKAPATRRTAERPKPRVQRGFCRCPCSRAANGDVKATRKKFPPPQMSGKSVYGVRIVLPTISVVRLQAVHLEDRLSDQVQCLERQSSLRVLTRLRMDVIVAQSRKVNSGCSKTLVVIRWSVAASHLIRSRKRLRSTCCTVPNGCARHRPSDRSRSSPR